METLQTPMFKYPIKCVSAMPHVRLIIHAQATGAGEITSPLRTV